jgi:hypothetical protein
MDDPPHVNKNYRVGGRKNKIFSRAFCNVSPAKNAMIRTKTAFQPAARARGVHLIVHCHCPTGD